MGSKRLVNDMLSVFDLEIAEGLNSSRAMVARVVFEYNRRTGLRSFRIISPGIPRTIASKLIAWLEKNVDPEDIELGFEARRVVAENLTAPASIS
ncbi:MAG: hypothetical protein A2170_06530 [Deltaproteobacteria bacterium RBG_13_53_10]|nr:MAG: hypothetical protein A2170_06530 [Deltaproteobacteria bacterium RBG_13_53_10]